MSPKTWFRLLGLSCLLLVVGFVFPALTQDAKKGKKYALLIGVTEYDSGKFTPLTYTENDVVELGKLLRGKTAGFDSVRVLTNKGGKKEKPTAANIRAALEELIAKKTRHDTILIALSGHGVQLEVPHPKDERAKPKVYGYFCPSDSDLRGASYSTGKSETLIQVKEVLDAMDDCGAGTKLLLMDACRNEMKALATTRSLDVRQFTIPENSAALFSCKPGQKAFETAKLKHGVFFHVVLEGLRGKAKNSRGDVTWARLSEYVLENVNDAVKELVGDGAKQDPHFVNNLAGKSPVLARIDAFEEEPKKDKDGGTKVVVDSFTNSIGMKLVRVKAGKFTMGSPKGEKDRSDTETEHPVEITKDFYLGVHEVTQGQFRTIMGFNPSYFSHDGKASDKGTYPDFSKPGGGKEKVKGYTQKQLDDFPVENVSWEDAQAFLRKLNARATEKRRVYRLPTEAEWEYACRGGRISSDKPFHFEQATDSLSSRQANFNGKFPYGGATAGKHLERTHAVGKNGESNRLGLFDMHGNVYEWCQDWYGSGYYGKSALKDPPGPVSGSDRVFRGGGWDNDGRVCRAARRGNDAPSGRSSHIGFRVAAVPPK